MNFRVLLKRSVIALLSAAGLVTLAYFFVDRPVAYWVNEQAWPAVPLLQLTYIPIGLEYAAPLVLVWVALRSAYGPASRFEWMLFAMSLNLLATVAIEEGLKGVFGRYWPKTWIDNNPSLIGDGAYGFHPGHWGVIYSSFPSGHTARIVAVMAILWIAYPRWRWLSVLLSAAVAIGLVGMDYHFVGDVIGGAFLGGITGAYAAHFAKLDVAACPPTEQAA